jgi:copper(I)-binding protein
MRRILVAIAGITALGLLAAPSWAADASAAHKPVELHGGWLQETTAGVPAEAYVTIENKGKTPDRLMFITGPDVDHVAINQPDKPASNVDPLMVPAGTTVDLGPGQAHLVVFGVDRPLKRGKTLFLVFHFEHAGDVSAYFVVRSNPATDDDAAPSFNGSKKT